MKQLFFFLIVVVLASCQNGPRRGQLTKIDPSNIESYGLLRGVSIDQEGFLLQKNNSSLSSRFKVRNFELTLNVKTTEGAEGELIFATGDALKRTDGYEIKINNSDYRNGSAQKTGSLSKIRNNFVRTANDNEWFNLSLVVHGNHIKVKVKDKTIVDYYQPNNPKRSKALKDRKLIEGYLKIEKTSKNGSIFIGDMTIVSLSKELKEEDLTQYKPDSTTAMIDSLNEAEFPLIDFHGHLKGGLTMIQAYQHAQKLGYNYGIAANCGLKFPVTNDSTLISYLHGIQDEPVLKAMQCEGREWVTLFKPSLIAQFDYIFTDAMTWTDLKGRRMRLWIPEETFVGNPEQFMNLLVSKIESILSQEPVDIHVNPTFLPPQLAADYDKLWTPERMDRVIKVLIKNDIALEINSRFKIPSIAFIKKAKEAGVKFTCGTNNGSNNDLGKLEYSLKAIKEARLTNSDMFIPQAKNQKKVLKVGLPAKITG